MKLPSAFIKDSDNINVIIETSKGSRNKYAFDPETELYKLHKALPAGLSFPTHFGFIPATKAADGDPVDVLVMMDEPSYPGCLAECRVLGVLTALQGKKGKLIRNDRIVAVAEESEEYNDLKKIKDLDKKLLKQIARFFEEYHRIDKEIFKLLGLNGTKKALKLIRKNLE